MELQSHTRLGLQAVIATSITLFLSQHFQLGHGFWATITVLFLLSNTWAEGLEKGLKRLLMTVLGCLMGWLILTATPSYFYTHLTFIFIFVFFSCYFIGRSYSTAIFTVTVLIILMLDLLGQHGKDVFFDRIIQTAIGGFIAFFVSRYIFPFSSTHQLEELIQDIFDELNEYLQFKLKTLKKNESYHPPMNEHIYIKMVEKITQAKTFIHQLSYERFFKRHSKHKHLSRELKLLTIVSHSIYSIIGIDETIETRLNEEDRLFTLEFIEKNILPSWSYLLALYGCNALTKDDDFEKTKLEPLATFLSYYQERGYNLEHPVLLSGLYYYLKKLLTAIDDLIELKGKVH